MLIIDVDLLIIVVTIMSRIIKIIVFHLNRLYFIEFHSFIFVIDEIQHLSKIFILVSIEIVLVLGT